VRAVLLFPALSALAFLPAAAAQTQTQPAAGPASAVSAPGDFELSQALAQIEQAARQANTNLVRLRIDKWKADPSTRRQAQTDADSLRSNLTAALPGMVDSARAAPGLMAPSLKLYQDLNALYGVLAELADSASVFAPKDDFLSLSADAQSISSARRALGDYLQQLAAFQDSELLRLHSQLAAAKKPASPVQKKVVDNDEPATKPKTRKTKPATTNATPPPASSSTSPK